MNSWAIVGRPSGTKTSAHFPTPYLEIHRLRRFPVSRRTHAPRAACLSSHRWNELWLSPKGLFSDRRRDLVVFGLNHLPPRERYAGSAARTRSLERNSLFGFSAF